MAINSREAPEDNGNINAAIQATFYSPYTRISPVWFETTLGDGRFGQTTGDFDWYSADFYSAGAVLTVRTIARNSVGTPDVNTVIDIRDPSGTLVATFDDTDGVVGDSFGQYVVPTTGKYYVTVRSAGNIHDNIQSS